VATHFGGHNLSNRPLVCTLNSQQYINTFVSINDFLKLVKAKIAFRYMLRNPCAIRRLYGVLPLIQCLARDLAKLPPTWRASE
jgi:hypothetical protein